MLPLMFPKEFHQCWYVDDSKGSVVDFILNSQLCSCMSYYTVGHFRKGLYWIKIVEGSIFGRMVPTPSEISTCACLKGYLEWK